MSVPSHRGAKWIVLILVLLSLPRCTPHALPPNVLLVVLDTVRADAVGGVINERKRTPELDRIAATGMQFEFAYATAPWTLPSHATLFTGLVPSQHRAVHEVFRLDDRFTTLAERLSERGYATYGITSNPWVTQGRGLAQGFALFDAAYSSSDPALDKGAARATDLANEFIEDAATVDRPFFLFVNYLEAHLPYAPPIEGFAALGVEPGRLDRDQFTIEEAEQIITGAREASDEELALARLLYSCEIAYQDQKLGQLVDALRKRNLLDDTLVIVTADHGEMLGSDAMMGHEFSLSDEVLRVPLILRLPGTFDSGARVSFPVSHLDIVPTVLDLIGDAAGIGQFEGQSLRTLLKSAPPERLLLAEYSEPRTLLNEYWASRHPDFDSSKFAVSLRSLRKASMKVVVNSRDEAVLYDHGRRSRDPEAEATTQRMRDELDAWIARLREGDNARTTAP